MRGSTTRILARSAVRAALFALALGLYAASGALAQAGAPAQPSDSPLSPGTPLRLVQPRLGIDAPIVPLGQTDDGAMAAPSDPDTIGWWSLGADASQEGNVVLAGHVNWAGRLRVFGRLDQAVPGDVFYLTDASGTEWGYVVIWKRLYDAQSAPLEEIFLPDAPGHQLTLITCGGRYILAAREYLDRIIVRAQRIE